MSFKISKEITADDVLNRLKKGEALNLLDVREPVEWGEGHIAGAKHIPLGQIGERWNEIDPLQETIVICRSGSRSGLACELLEERGFNVISMAGGMSAWKGEME
ncbi:putative adenylyltransferase/sulfurtransferase MoeZ [compost metagenome]